MAPKRTPRFSPLPSARRAIPWNRSPIRFWSVAVCPAAGALAHVGACTRSGPGSHQTDKIHLLFNNAGIGGGGSMVTHSSDEWERTFNICWGGVYNCTRAFLPMLQNAEEGHIVNTSSINGFWASVGPRIPHTAYSAREIRGQGVHRGADHGSADQRAAHQMLGRHARPDRDLDPRQHAQDPQHRSRIGRDRCCRSRAGARAICFAGPRRLAAVG
jgi:NAD(P)-dependent dehydrogenase (short-subunit alcohol dehydrogenase family)